MIGLVITVIILLGLGMYVYPKFIKPMMSGKVGEAYTEALNDFNANKETIMGEYFADKDRFALFRQVIPDEQIVGIASFTEPKKVGKSITEGLKTSVTGVKKVNVDMFYMVVADKHLHAIEFDGENSIDHTVFDLAEVRDVEVGRVSAKDQMMGVDGGLVRFKFKYKDNDYSYNLYKTMFGFPRFEPVKDVISGSWGVKYFYELGNVTSKNMMEKATQIDQMVHHNLYEGFTGEINKKFKVNFPA